MELKATKIQKVYGTTTVLDDISFVLDKGQKIGLIGYNGTGKSTLLKILAGEVLADAGEITTRSGLRIGYVPQDTSLVSDESITDYIRRVSGMADLEERMGSDPSALDAYDRRNGYDFYHRLEIMLSGFGLADLPTAHPINQLSSGQKSKVFIVAMLLSDPDVFLMDEPTNNLDLPALVWLEDFLVNTEATCVIISHDRLFLDRVINKIFEIDWHSRSLNITSGKYSDYLERKAKAISRQKQQYQEQQDEIERLKERARQQKQKAASGAAYAGTDNDKFLRGFKRDRAGKSGKAAKATEKRIEQMDLVENPFDRDVFEIDLSKQKPKGDTDISMVELVVGHHQDKPLLNPISMTIPYGSRIGILGLNGTGKSTLIKTICGNLQPLSGTVHVGRGLKIGNFTQEHDQLIRGTAIKDFLMERTGLEQQEVYALASRYGFKSDEMKNEIGVLSPGGRARLLFALFSRLEINVLVLDEPTNHLDLEVLDALEEVVVSYPGTILLISHDRSFPTKFNPTELYVLADGKLNKEDSFDHYLSQAEKQARRLMKML